MAGYWKTYILKSGAEIKPPPPYPCGSKEDLSNLQGVLNASNNRTSQQIAAVHHWGDTPPATIWNNMLVEYIKRNNIGLFDSARAFAYLNVAMHDAVISTWYTKYTYWTARPFQRITNFTTSLDMLCQLNVLNSIADASNSVCVSRHHFMIEHSYQTTFITIYNIFLLEPSRV